MFLVFRPSLKAIPSPVPTNFIRAADLLQYREQWEPFYRLKRKSCVCFADLQDDQDNKQEAQLADVSPAPSATAAAEVPTAAVPEMEEDAELQSEYRPPCLLYISMLHAIPRPKLFSTHYLVYSLTS